MILSIVVTAVALTCCQVNVWNGISPLKSTRADVEKILGKPMPHSVARDAASYKTKDGTAFVLYSTGPCSIRPSNGWDIPELTVISVSVYPDVLPKLDDLEVDKSKFEKRADPGMIDTFVYTNNIDGVRLTVDEKDHYVLSMHFFPEAKYDHLKCKPRDEL